mgnify:CR=1 FL=1
MPKHKASPSPLGYNHLAPMNTNLPPLNHTVNHETPTTGNRFAFFLATGLGVGFCPVMPGTVGSLWGLPLVWGLLKTGLPWWSWLIVALVLFLVGIPMCAQAAKRLKKADPGSIVWDEIAAFGDVFFPLVLLQMPLDFVTAAAGFAWFRLFDILKPWPISREVRVIWSSRAVSSASATTSTATAPPWSASADGTHRSRHPPGDSTR